MKRSRIEHRVRSTVYVSPHYTQVNSLTRCQVRQCVSSVDLACRPIMLALVNQLAQDLAELLIDPIPNTSAESM